MMGLNKKTYLMIFIISVLIFFFQNCSKVQLESAYQASTYSSKGLVCLDNIGEIQNPHRVIFFIDNSGSMKGIDGESGGESHRVRALRGFIQKYQNNDNFEISIGTLYDRQTGFLPDPLDPQFPTQATPQASCSFLKPRDLEDRVKINQALDQLNQQARDPINNSPFMGVLNQMQNCIETYRTPGENYRYSLVFLSDGAPTDVTVTELVSKVTQIISLGNSGSGFSIGNIDLFMLFLDQYNANPDAAFLIDESIRAAQRAGGLRSRALVLNPDEPYNYNELGLIEDIKYRMKQVWVTNNHVSINAMGVREADSDGDGLSDSEEANYLLDPTDYASNGQCSDLVYVKNGMRCPSSCSLASRYMDSDKDGLSDCDESTLATHSIKVDTDLDGIPDGIEYKIGLSPVDPADLQGDADGDGISNFVEALRFTSPYKDDRKIKHKNHVDISLTETINSNGYYCYQIKLQDIGIYPTLGSQKTLESNWSVPGENIIRVLLQVTPSDRPSVSPKHLVSYKSFMYRESVDGLIPFYDNFSSEDFEKIDEE